MILLFVLTHDIHSCQFGNTVRANGCIQYCKVYAVEKGIEVCGHLQRSLLFDANFIRYSYVGFNWSLYLDILFGEKLCLFLQTNLDVHATSLQNVRQKSFLGNKTYNLIVKFYFDCRSFKLYFQFFSPL